MQEERDLVKLSAMMSRACVHRGKGGKWGTSLGEAGRLSSESLHGATVVLPSPLALEAQKPAVSS